ncbi:MAG: hypothetical protein A2Y73_06750 [Chloroflexi bacterium RBG_13_56_8]|nr:MAG: hypothetical protein A2Y73_06750 [Chloroflexi bacterium RBG_13_56_8]
MEYLNFDLRLGEWNPLSYTGIAEVLQSPAGEGERYPFTLKDGHLLIAKYSRRDEAAAMGRKLAESILPPQSLTLWYESYQIARERSRGLRLRLHIDSWELSRIPWELLYDARREEFFVFDPLVSLVRYLRLHAAPPALRESKTLKVLAIAANPRGQALLNWKRELAVLRQALSEFVQAGRIEIIASEHTTHELLHSLLLESTPDVVHFIGHGEYDRENLVGRLILEDEQGRAAPFAAPEVARLLRRYGVNLVVLNACETAKGAWAGLAPALVRAEIPAVVAMQWPVEDRAAIRFCRCFYQALFAEKTVDECVAEGRVGASSVGSNPRDWGAPVLFLRSLSGRLWTSDLGRIGRKSGRIAPVPSQDTASGETPTSAPLAQEKEVLFKTRGPLLSSSDQTLIIDRPELRRAVRLAQQPSVTQYIAFLSARQTGKTTLLFRLMDLLKDAYACIFVDLSVLRAQDARACFRFVAFRLISEFRDLLGPSAPLPEAPHIEGSVEFLEFLRGLADMVPIPRIVLLLDEVGALSAEVSDSFFNTIRTVFTQGRSLNSNLSKYLFVFSGAVDLYALTFGSNSPLNICEKIYLHDFALPDVEKIVGQFHVLGAKVAQGSAERIYALAAGHPYLTTRMCTLLEQAKVKEVTPAQVDAVAQEMLVEDDNIHHVIHELEQRPLERRRLHNILLEGQKVPFSRNDPVLASLEMIGAIRAAQPCEVRNLLYERALRQYFARVEGDALRASTSFHIAVGPSDEIESVYSRLQALRLDALDSTGTYRLGKPWETFAAALFSMLPAFSIRPEASLEDQSPNVVLAIDSQAPGGVHWSIYQPSILVQCLRHRSASPQRIITQALGTASRHSIRLVLVMTAGAPSGWPGGMCGDVCIVPIADAEIAELLQERRDLDAFLREKVLEARLRKAE